MACLHRFSAVFYFLILPILFLIACDKKDNLSETTFKPINSPSRTQQSANSSSLLIGTWYLNMRFGKDGTPVALGECEKKRSATYKIDGTCIHKRFVVVNEKCELSNSYSCNYTFEFDIITSTTDATGTTKSIVKFTDSKTLEVYDNTGNKIAVYKKPR